MYIMGNVCTRLHLRYLDAIDRVPGNRGCSVRAPLLGHNLVRLLYLDEAGTDHRAPFISVAGVLVHGDTQYPEIERRILALADKYIPEPDRLLTVFHATDIFHGSGYFDRRKPEWSDQEKRIRMLDELAKIIDDLHLPVIFGNYERAKFESGKYTIEGTAQDRTDLLHDVAILDCLARTDKWLARYAPDELAAIYHEDLPRNKERIKQAARIARSPALIKAVGWTGIASDLDLPLKRIIDSVHFVDKADAKPLQLADLCAFVLARGLKGAGVPQYATEVIFRHLKWVMEDNEKFDSSGPRPSDASEEKPPS